MAKKKRQTTFLSLFLNVLFSFPSQHVNSSRVNNPIDSHLWFYLPLINRHTNAVSPFTNLSGSPLTSKLETYFLNMSIYTLLILYKATLHEGWDKSEHWLTTDGNGTPSNAISCIHYFTTSSIIAKIIRFFIQPLHALNVVFAYQCNCRVGHYLNFELFEDRANQFYSRMGHYLTFLLKFVHLNFIVIWTII